MNNQIIDRRCWRLGLWVCFWVFLAAPLSARAELQLEGSPLWGFDGKVRLENFNLLTFDLRNDSAEPWQGNVKVGPRLGISEGDVPVLQPDLYIEGYGVRRLQFLLFLPSVAEYRISWGLRHDQKSDLPEPVLTDVPAKIELMAEGALSKGSSFYPRFLDSDFPASAAGLETLGTIYLDHIPAWSEGQRQALKDWLWAGGTLYLAPGLGGKRLEFSGVLSELNQPEDLFHPGGGTVFRVADFKSLPRDGESGGISNRYLDSPVTTNMLTQLRGMTQPDHNWGVIYSLAIIYLLMLYPGCWLISRRRGDFRVGYAIILGVVALFSFGFRTVGARGYGEETSAYSVAVARTADDGRALVKQWTNLFVTSGDQYLVTHELEGAAYSSGQQQEAVLGQSLNRPRSVMMVDIPAFSARTFVDTGVIATGNPRPKILNCRFGKSSGSGAATLEELELEFPDDSLWRDDPKMRMEVLVGSSLHGLHAAGNRLTLKTGARSLSDEISVENLWGGRSFFGQTKDSPEILFNQLFSALVASDLNIYTQQQRTDFRLPAGELIVYLYGTMPESYYVSRDKIRQQHGRVLHSIRMISETVP